MFGVLPNLTHLYLSGCFLPALPPAVLSSMPTLTSLRIDCQEPQDLPEELGQRLPELRAIHLQYPADLSRVALSGAKKLEEIDAYGCRFQVEEPLDWLLEALPLLQRVRLGR